MADSEMDGGASRDELLQRVELMEEMIAEGRGSTTRNAWILVLWGVVDLVGAVWQHGLPHSNFAGRWAWPICLGAGVVLTFAGKALQGRDQARDRGYRKGIVSSRVMTVWAMMGLALGIYITGAMFGGWTWQVSYLSGMLMMVGMAHAISAAILRWRAQGVVAAIWWAGGIAILTDPPMRVVEAIMFLELSVGMIAFGVYAMVVEGRSVRRATEAGASNHA